tara:strand:+ start:642 stop:1376 length:735 start_codon:yes stop_codon:yes gene_type:complete
MEYYEDVIDAYESGVGVLPGESLTDYIKRNNIDIIEMDTFRLKDSGRSKEANGGIMRNFYADGDEVEEFQEDDLSEIELMKDQGIPYGEQVRAQDSGIMQMADRDPLLEDEYNKYRFDMLEQGLDPMSFDEFRREAMSDQAAIDPKIRIEEVVMEFIKQRGRKPNSLDELKEFYEMRMGTARNPGMDVVKELVEDDKTRITLAGGSFPDLDGSGDITQKDILIGKGVLPRDEKQSGGLAAILGL